MFLVHKDPVPSHHLPFRTDPTRPMRLHSSAIVAPRKFQGISNALQVCGIPECRTECEAQFCDILRLLLLTQAQYIGDQHPTGKQGIELCCSPHGVVLYRGCPKQHPCLPGTSCHFAIWQSCITTCFTQSLKTFLCTMNSCHFNFDPGTLL